MKNYQSRQSSPKPFLKVNRNEQRNKGRNQGGRKNRGYRSCGGQKNLKNKNNKYVHHYKWDVYKRESKDKGP